MFPNLTFLSLFKSENITHTHLQPPHYCSVHIPSLLKVSLLDQKQQFPEDFSLPGHVFNSQDQKIREKKEYCLRNPCCNTCSS